MTTEGPRSPRSVSLRTLLALLLVVLVVVAVAFALGQRGKVDDLEAELGERTAVATAAARFGEVYLSYDFSDPERTGAAVLDLASEAFAEEFETERAPGIEELFSNLGTTTRATTTEVFVGDVSDDGARVLMVVDIEASSEASGTQKLANLSFVLDMVKVEGAWLVDRVNPAPQPDLTGDGVVDGPAPASTTTTAVP